MKTLPKTATFAEFARIAGYKPSYITELKKRGLLILEGRRILVQPTLDKLEANRDPAKAGVRNRHAKNRAAKSTPPKPAPPPPASAPEPDDDPAPDQPANPQDKDFYAARARKEHWNAKAAERDFLLRDGQLMEATDVTRSATTIATNLRARLERMPNILAPQLAAETDETQTRSLLADYIDDLLGDLEQGLRGLAKDPAA